jgi:coniferyl-aldehyde dehydrogenase
MRPLRIARRRVRRWMRAERRAVGFPECLTGARAEVHYQPLGCVGLISPWNFPINLTVVPLAGILAAGNRAMIKPSEATPATAALLQEMFAASFAADEVAVITGGVEVGKAFAALPFDHLLYTGNAGVAREIMAAAAANLTPLTLELGGKCPVIVGHRADLGHVARRVLFGKWINAGQICLAPDQLYVRKSLLASLVETLQASGRTLWTAERAHQDFVSLVNARHHARLSAWREEARAAGATVIELGPPVGSGDAVHNLLPITLIVDPPDGCAISREEIFGPLLVIRTYEHFDEVIAALQADAAPLAIYHFGRDRAERQRLLDETSSGALACNDVVMQYTIDDLPFGGVGASGMGAYHGFDGFRRFSHARAVFRQGPVGFGRLLSPPYGPRFRQLCKLMLRFG